MKKLNSCTVIPKDLYVERDADLQIKRIIDGMGRPGYVLVARQMGKTNLLLHTREKMQSDKVIFSFIDFSTIGGYTETECFNHIIDETINSNSDIFKSEEIEIDAIRSKPNYSGHKMFTKELRVLLKNIDKLVFILDEIDALTRTTYSDHIFSTIRSHYFQRANHPELNKLTYILSGVIEPKDIIKDPDISPFNIGEKIYMNDFSKKEFDSFISKAGLHSFTNSDVINRIFYWTKGNPRLTWDICSLVEDCHIKTVNDLDTIIQKEYLTSFDKVPVDAIRTKVQKDDALKDAIIQLQYNKGETLDSDLKSRLYLAGIIEFDNTIPRIKNAILERCLDIKWLLSLPSSSTDYLAQASNKVFLEKDYSGAIILLEHIISENKIDEPEKMDTANYLLEEAYFRSFQNEKSIKQFNNYSFYYKTSDIYYKSLLTLGYNYSTLEKWEDATLCFQKIIENTDPDSKTNILAIIGKINILISSKLTQKTDEADSILNDILRRSIIKEKYDKEMTICFFYKAQIEAFRGNSTKAITNLDNALRIAQRNEKQILLYEKLKNSKEADKTKVAEELFLSLEYIITRPEAENFDNPLALNNSYSCHILAELMLHYPHFDVTRYLRTFLYDSKENAAIAIYQVLQQDKDSKIREYAKYLIDLYNNKTWTFDEEQKIKIATIALQNGDKQLASPYIEKLLRSSSFELSDLTKVMIIHWIDYHISKNQNLNQIIIICNLLYNEERFNSQMTLDLKSFLIYFYACAYFRLHDYSNSMIYCIKLLNLIESKNINNYIKEDDIRTFHDFSQNILAKIAKYFERLKFYLIDESKLGRNDKIRVVYYSPVSISINKYKLLTGDIAKNKCYILEKL